VDETFCGHTNTHTHKHTDKHSSDFISVQCHELHWTDKNYMFHSYNTRIKDSLHVDLFASSLGQRSITYKGSILRNTLPEEITAITSTVSFVNKLHKILM